MYHDKSMCIMIHQGVEFNKTTHRYASICIYCFLTVLLTLEHQATSQLTTSGCRHGTLRLVNGSQVDVFRQGRVEVCINNIWGTITFDGDFQEEAVVICQQLGFTASDGTLA